MDDGSLRWGFSQGTHKAQSTNLSTVIKRLYCNTSFYYDRIQEIWQTARLSAEHACVAFITAFTDVASLEVVFFNATEASLDYFCCFSAIIPFPTLTSKLLLYNQAHKQQQITAKSHLKLSGEQNKLEMRNIK